MADARTWFASFENVRREHGFEPIRVEGEVPADLRGTFYRNGPGIVVQHGHRYRHWFDGDGCVSAVRFGDGTVEGAVRVLETAGRREEQARGKAYFGGYGSRSPGMWNPLRALRLMKGTSKNPANTNLLLWDDRLLALCEIGRPFEVDPSSLASIGSTDLDGVVPGAFSAHPHRLEANGYVYNIGTRIGRPNAIDVFAMRPDGTAGRMSTIPLEFPTMIHDFAATPRALVIFVAPLKLKLLPMLLGLRAFSDALTWTPELGTEVIVVPFDTPSSPVRFEVDPFWSWHIGNAFEHGDEIAIDLVRFPDFPTSADWLAGIASGGPSIDADGVLTRTFVDPARQTVRHEPLADPIGEFPRVAPHLGGEPHRYVYWAEFSSAEAGRQGPPNAVSCVDTETGARDAYVFEAGHSPSEAVFAPRGEGERNGWLLTQVYDASAHETYFAVLDAQRVSDGPVCTAHLDHHVPLSFHGLWAPGPAAG